MRRPQEPHKPFFQFGKPFGFMRPKASPELVALLNKFEENLSGRYVQLMPKDGTFTFILSWMTLAMNLLCQTHNDVKNLITDLELPVLGWEEKWIDVYLDNAINMLDICIAFRSEISRLSDAKLLLKCVLHNLDDKSEAESSLNSWCKLIASTNQKVVKCSTVIDQLVQSIDLPRIKNSAKGKVLMHAMYGVSVQSIFICNVFISSLTGSADNVFDLHVSEKYSWAEAYTRLQSCVHNKIRDLKASKPAIVELSTVDDSAKALLSELRESEAVNVLVSELKTRTEALSGGLDELRNEVERFFSIVLSGHTTLVDNVTAGCGFSESPNQKKEFMNL